MPSPDERADNWRTGCLVVLLAPILVPVWLAIIIMAWYYTAAAWSALKDIIGF